MGQAADGQDEETAVLVERPIEQIPEQRVHAVIGAQVGLMEHPGIDLAPEQVLEQDVRFLVQDLAVAQVASPVVAVEEVVLVRPLGRRGHVVEEVDRPPRDHEDVGLVLVVDPRLRRRVVHPRLGRVGDEEADAGVVGGAHGIRVREPGDVGRDQRAAVVVRESHRGGRLVVARDLPIDAVIAGGVRVQVLVGERVVDPRELGIRQVHGRGEQVGRVDAGRALAVERHVEAYARGLGLELFLRLPRDGGRPVDRVDAVGASPVHVVVDEDVVDLRRHVDVALSEEQPSRDPVQEAVRERQAVDQEEVSIERRGEHLPVVGVGPDQRERVVLRIGQEQTDSGVHAVQRQAQHSQGEPPCRAAAAISRYCGSGKGGAQRRGNKGQSRFRGHSRWFTESRNKIISSKPV